MKTPFSRSFLLSPFSIFLSFISLSTIFLTQCGKLNEIRVVGRNFEDEINLAQNLVFTFNKDIVPTADLNSWESTKFVEFIPAVAGKFKWTAPNELVFSPASGFEPATEYRAELSKELAKKTIDKKYDVSGEEMAFHTPYLQLTEAETYWTQSRATGKPLAKTKLHFNYAVNGSEVGGKLKAKSDEKTLNQSILQTQTSEAVTVSLNDAPADKNEQPLELSLEKGLKVPNTAYTSKEDLKLSSNIPSATKLEVRDVKTGFENNRGMVRIVTTQELKNENLSAYYTIQPEVQTKAELTENGFVIRGDFNETDTYVLTLTDQVQGVLGARLEEAVTKDLFFGEMPASISFANKKAIYLSSKGARNVGVQIVNIPKVQVKIAKIYENNILQYLRSNRYEEYGNVGGEDNWAPTGNYTYEDDYNQTLSDVIVDKTVETDNLPKVKGVSALNLGLPDAPNAFRGIYVVTVQSKDEQYNRAVKLVSLSDIGLIAKQGKDELWVFANSIKTAEPLDKLEISLISTNNQTVLTARTDSKGVVKFEKLSEKAPNFKIAMVVAKTLPTKDNIGDDFNYLFLEDTQVETSRFEVEGKRDNSSGFEAFVYGDRDIYRPGETIHFNTVVRQQSWKSVGEIPLKIKVLLPNGKELKTYRLTTNSEGAVETSLTLDKAAVTGGYSIEVYNGNDVLLASKKLNIEEFMPDRIKVDVKANQEFYRTGQTIQLNATALNLFGPPASGRNYEMEFSLKKKAFFAEKYKDYIFDIPSNNKYENVVRQGITDDNGLAKENFSLPATYQDLGVLEGKIYVTVFDETGRPVNRLKRFDVFTQEVFYGVRLPDSYVGLNAPVPIGLVAVDKDGRPKATTTAQIDVIRMDYQTVVEKQNEQLRYTSKKREKVVYSNVVTFKNGLAEVRYVPTVSGEYEVRIRRTNGSVGTPTTGYSVTSFYAYGWGSTSASSFEVSNEGEVLMEFDKASYKVGDKATVLFKTPFAGKLLVTVERNRVLEHHYLDTDNKSAEFSFSVGDEHLPNIYLTATLIRPLDNSNLPLTVAHGFASVKVEDNDTQLPVEIVAVEKSRSKTKQKIKIKTARNAQVTIAVVDEGILQIKNFQTPDIHGFFYQKRALEVSSHDLYPFLFPELSLASSSSVGGDGYDLEKRINPLSNGRVNLVAYWSGQLETGLSGEAEFEVDIPQFSGDLRIMAVAYKDNAFGSSNKNMKVADPIVISTALPRFLSPDDELIVPVNVTNTEKKAVSVNVSLTVNGQLQNLQGKAQTLSIAPEKESRTTFVVKAAKAMGIGNVTVTVSNGKEKFIEKTELTVRPATSLLKTSQSGVIVGGNTGIVDLRGNDFIPSTVSSKLVVSRSPMVQYAKALDYLLGYPHGCIEQTISKAFPQIYFADIAKTMSPQTYVVKTGESDFNPTFNVQAAIQKIESMQLPNGAVSYWPSSTEESAWGTAYATHFLIEAQRAGFEINASALGRMLDYLTVKTGTPATEIEYVLDETGSYNQLNIASRSSLYSLYVLSLGEKANRASMNYYKQNQQLLTADTRYLLAAAFKQIGDERSYYALLPANYIPPLGVRGLSGSFASPIRNLALTLNSLIETDPNNIQIPTLARRLSQALNATSYLNTQEAAFSFLALGKLAKKNAGNTATAKFTVNGKSYQFEGKDLNIAINSPLRGSGAASGKGSLYWFAQSEGLSATGDYVEEDAGLRVRKQFFNRNGQPLSTFRQNDLVVVKVTLSSTDGSPVENVVVTDLLPAAFEIENPRLTEPRDMPWIKNATVPDHFDIRDDRINYYTTANSTEKTFYYMVRVITKGTFTLGPVSADAMYSGDFRSYSGGGKVKVE